MKKQTQKLPKEFKKKWVAALRSGKYEQGTGRLYSGATDSYCCLGVACRVAGIPLSTIGNLETIPQSVKNVPKMLQGTADENDLVGKLAGWNDGFAQKLNGARRSFNWIASYIERYL